ncbi:MAG: hypothetical protein JWM11_4757 [Planctomycetaceae bacterium]|nr:hypothetical protein [Planctomycetaceae bacterium]
MELAILDTDILSEVLKRKDLQVLASARQYLIEHQRLVFSAMTLYEVVPRASVKSVRPAALGVYADCQHE